MAGIDSHAKPVACYGREGLELPTNDSSYAAMRLTAVALGAKLVMAAGRITHITND